MELKLYRKPELKKPIMLTGTPGMGLVAKQTVDYFIDQLKAELFGDLSYPYGNLPVAFFGKDGLLKPKRYEKPFRFYFYKNELKNDLIFFTGDIQPSHPEKQNELADKVADIAKELQVKRIYAAAALPINQHVEEPKVVGVASKPDLLEFLKENGIPPMRGEISGFNGIIIEYAWKKGIEGICLLSETHAYHINNPYDPIDFKACLALIKKFSELIEIKIDTSRIENETINSDRRFHLLEKEYKKEMEKYMRRETEDLSYIG